MNVKLVKTEEDKRLFYLVQDKENRNNLYDYFEFPNEEEMPELENACFKLMYKELSKYLSVKDYSSRGFKNHLFLLEGLSFEENRLDISTLTILTPVITNLRFKSLYNTINRFRAFGAPDQVERYKDYVLEFDYSDFPVETKNLVDEVFRKLDIKCSKDKFFKEILFLSFRNEYERAIVKAKKRVKMLEDIDHELEIASIEDGIDYLNGEVVSEEIEE